MRLVAYYGVLASVAVHMETLPEVITGMRSGLARPVALCGPPGGLSVYLSIGWSVALVGLLRAPGGTVLKRSREGVKLYI